MAALAGLAMLLVYAPQVAPGLLGGDPGEFQMAAWLAGLAHPTGYPLYLLLGWIWTHALARLGVEPAAAMNWLSAILAAATVAVSVVAGEALQRRVTPHSPPPTRLAVAALVALAFGASATFRSQALVAEVYALNALFLVLLLSLLLERAPLPWLALLYGLSLAHHRTMLLWLPAFLAFLWLDRRGELRPGALVRSALLAALPQALYLYVPLRGPRSPYLHQELAPGQTLDLYDGSPRAFLEHVAGTVFRGELGAGGTLPERVALVARLAGEQIAAGGDGAGAVVLAAGLLLVVVLAAAGWLAARRHWPALALLGLGALGTVAFGVAYGIGDVEVMFIPAWLALALLVEPPAGALAARSRSLTGATTALAVLLALALLVSAWRSPRGATSSVRAAWEALLAAPPPRGAILISNDRNEVVPLWYLQFVEGRRPDLLGLFPLVTRRPEHADVGAVVASAMATGRPVRLIKPMPGLDLRYELAAGEGPLVAVSGPAAIPSRPPAEEGPAPELIVVGWSIQGDSAASGVTLRPEGTLTVTLGLRVNGRLPRDLTTYVHLLGPRGALVAQSDHQAGGLFYPSQLWPAGATLRDRHRLELPPVLAPGLYQLRAGAYRLGPGGPMPFGNEIALGRITTATAAEAISPPVATVAVGEAFGRPPLIELAGYALSTAEPTAGWRPVAGDPLTVTLAWRALGAPAIPYTTFVHLIPEGSEAPAAQVDEPPRADDYPTDVWQPGDAVTQTLRLELPQAPGRYRLVAGLYDARTGERLPAATGDSLTLAVLDVEAGR